MRREMSPFAPRMSPFPLTMSRFGSTHVTLHLLDVTLWPCQCHPFWNRWVLECGLLVPEATPRYANPPRVKYSQRLRPSLNISKPPNEQKKPVPVGMCRSHSTSRYSVRTSTLQPSRPESNPTQFSCYRNPKSLPSHPDRSLRPFSRLLELPVKGT